MTAFAAIVGATIGQILPVRRLIWLGVLAASPALLVFLVTSGGSSQDLEVFVPLTVGLFFSGAVPVVTLVLASSSLGGERRDQTLSFVVLKPIPRTMLALAKIVASLAASAIVLGGGAILLGVARGVRGGEWEYIIPLVVSAIIGAGAYASLFTPLGFLTNRATLLGLAYVSIWEGAVAGAIPALRGSSAWRIGFSAFAAMVPDEVSNLAADFALESVEPGVGGAIVKTLVVIGIAALLTTWILRRRDLA